ncbi:MAG TPA: hypothetical protein VH796_10095 [Nitrososphaeraceae archaeon]
MIIAASAACGSNNSIYTGTRGNLANIILIDDEVAHFLLICAFSDDLISKAPGLQWLTLSFDQKVR